MRYFYFVSFFMDGSDGKGFGNCCLDTAFEVNTVNHTEKLKRAIEEKTGNESIVILNFILLRSVDYSGIPK